MSIANATESAIMALVYQAVAWASYADNAAISPETSIAVALHTADPTDSGDMSSFEPTYTPYARVLVPRTLSGWTLTGGQVSPVAPIDFPQVTTGTVTPTHFSTGQTGPGAMPILWSGTVTPATPVGVNGTPRLSQATVISLD